MNSTNALNSNVEGLRGGSAKSTGGPRRTAQPGIVDRWEHGYVRRDAKGNLRYYIATKAKLPGAAKTRYDVATSAVSLDQAFKAWERFKHDPDGFTAEPPPAAKPEPPLILDAALALRFLTWSRNEKENSDGWVASQRQCLAWWSTQLRETDLRVTGGTEAKRLWLKSNFDRAKVGATSWAQKVAVLSALFSWLRRVEHELSVDTDPLYGAIERPAAAKPSLSKVAITSQRFAEIREEMVEGPYKWAFEILIATGRHAREVEQFARAGEVEDLPADRPDAKEGLPLAAAVLALPHTKAGVPAAVAVSEPIAESARKLRALGAIPAGRDGKGWERAVYDACEAADLKAGRIDAALWSAYQAELQAVGSERARDNIRAAWRKKNLRSTPASGIFHLGWARRTLRTYASSKGYVGFVDAFQGHAGGTGARNYDRAVPFKVATMI